MAEIRCATCLLRPVLVADAASIARHANDRDIWINLRDRFPHPYELGHAEAFAARLATDEVQTTFAIVVDGQASGTISLMPGTDVERVSAEIGYWLGKAFWGRGVMTDAVRALTTYAFDTLKFNRIFALPFADNVASLRVLEKAGYVREGAMRRSAIKDGRLRNQYMYGTYDDTWPTRMASAVDSPIPPLPIG